MIIGSFFVPVGLLWYGWTAQAKTHFILPIIGGGVFVSVFLLFGWKAVQLTHCSYVPHMQSTGMMLVYLPIQLYLVDAFTYAASALAAASSFRALFGFVFPLFGEQMFAALGSGGGNSLLAGVAVVTGVPFPVWLYYRGEQARLRNPLNR